MFGVVLLAGTLSGLAAVAGALDDGTEPGKPSTAGTPEPQAELPDGVPDGEDIDARPPTADATAPDGEPVVELPEVSADPGGDAASQAEVDSEVDTDSDFDSEADPEPEARDLAGDEAVEAYASRLQLELVSREFQPGDSSWVIVVDAVLDSNALCIPAVFDCIIEPEVDPLGATLVDLECQSPGWNHLIFFTDHCIKQLGDAGFGQRVQMTYRTDPGFASGAVDIDVRFGRGVLPLVFNELATATLNVDLSVSLDLKKTCPAVVTAGDPISCTITVTYPIAGGGPSITDAQVTDVEPGGAFTSGALTVVAPGGATWSCAALTCSISSGSLEPGAIAVFGYTATVAPSTTGSEVVNFSELSYDDGGPIGRVDPALVTIAGTSDVNVLVSEIGPATVVPGSAISWRITVTHPGDVSGGNTPALNVVLRHTPASHVDGVTLRFAEGVGTWTCTAGQCTTATMPRGDATFLVTGTVSAAAPIGAVLIDQVEVAWTNDIFGPDFPVAAFATTTVVAEPAPPAPPASGPSGITAGGLVATGLRYGGIAMAGVAMLGGGAVLAAGTRRRALRA